MQTIARSIKAPSLLKRSIHFSSRQQMRIVTIPLNSDNYGYLIIDESTNEAGIIDVSNQPQAVINCVQREHVNLTKVLTTHKHWDHAGGNLTMKEFKPDIEVIGSTVDNVEGCTHFVEDNDEIRISGIKIKCILTPGHTLGHVSYFAEHNDQRAVFTGDCLFVGGCGRFFEGTAESMYPSLYSKLGELPGDTLVYCGHEYTLANYKFAVSIDAANEQLIAAYQRAQQLRDQGLTTMPSTIEQERQTNPFMRASEPALQQFCMSCTGAEAAAAIPTPVQVLAAIREAKNNFR